MADGGSGFSTRTSTEDQYNDDRLVYETLFKHFKRHKVEISNAIKKPFPFFECLRDRELISNKMYDDCQDSCRNLVPVPRVAYNVLNELEKTFDLPLLEALFSEVNRQEYPNLNHIYKSFEFAIQEKINYQESDEEEVDNSPHTQLSIEQGTGENCYRSLTSSCPQSSSDHGTAPSENGPLENLCEAEQINGNRTDTTSDKNDAQEVQQANEEYAQESEPAESCEQEPIQVNNRDTREDTPIPLPCDGKSSPLSNHGIQVNSCSVHLVDIKKEKPFFSSTLNQASDVIVISSDSEETSDEDKAPEDSMSTLESGPAKRFAEYLESSEDEGPPRASCFVLRSDTDEEDPVDIGNKSLWGIPKRKRYSLDNQGNWKRKCVATSGEGRKPVITRSLRRGRKRGPRIPRDTRINFYLLELPVTCGEAKGTLYKEKMIQGTSEKCIQGVDGRWFTLREFEVEGKYSRSKNWKTSVRCGGFTLKDLIKKKYLPEPPRRRRRKQTTPEPSKDFFDPYPGNSNICEVCRRPGKLFCCDTCPKSFHETCHIHHIDVNREPWSCIFCMIKALQPSQQCHQISEVLQRRMVPEEQLKCEFVLLKVYCCSKSPFFASRPHYSNNASHGPTKLMWLNKIKKKLNKKLYLRVKGFVQDMCLIFENHRAFYKDNQKFIKLGFQLEDIFMNTFGNIFAIQEIREHSFQLDPTLS
ncbi:nuclear autoantigen Sp-100 isoform X15 [Mustela putorius furo]|uniref:Nuclear autoantigen Sp-100 isoform X15 n=1 Tax=Mustela putorius furo TaxID=9669 RepID=A0A8U0NB78_MUSPF|nr:nuclear autoantigen Sp-100 isoform X15 [Mustela putorius furo]